MRTISLNLIFLLLVLPACAVKYSSFDNPTGGTYELIVAEEKIILDAAYESIQRQFPQTIITNLSQNEKGFAFYTQPLLDRTTFKFSIEKAQGSTDDNKIFDGYFYSIYAQGTQFFVESRYISPLKDEFKDTLKKKGATLVLVQSVKFDKKITSHN